jgi:hypothetical protein
MASPSSKNQKIERLIRLSEESRSILADHASAIRQRLDVPTRLRLSLKENPTQWLFGGLASGAAAGFLFRRKAPSVKNVKNRSLPLALLGITFAAVRPLLQVWFTAQVKNYIAGKPIEFPAISSRSPRPHPTSSF